MQKICFLPSCSRSCVANSQLDWYHETAKQYVDVLPVRFSSAYLNELETSLEDASEHIDCPCLAQLLIAILMFADDIALFSYSPRGLQHQLNIHRSSVLHEVSR